MQNMYTLDLKSIVLNVCITIFIEPNPVTNVSTSNKDTHTVTVTWTVPNHEDGDDFYGYEYQLFDTAIVDAVRSENNLSPGTTQVVFKTLTPGNTYRIEIKSVIFDAANTKLYGSVASHTFTMGKYISKGFLSLCSKYWYYRLMLFHCQCSFFLFCVIVLLEASLNVTLSPCIE